jgi:hypothetical protein
MKEEIEFIRTDVLWIESWKLFLLAFALALALVERSDAFDQPSVNLGASTFFDGAAQGPGLYYNQYFQYYHADRFNDLHGGAIPGTPHLDTYTSLTQLIYLTPWPHILGARLGFDALIPVVGLDTSPENTFLNANNDVLGDLTIGVALQFDPIMHGTNPVFVHRLDLDWIVPTGSYDRKFALNPGANFASFNPYWAGTLFLGSKVVTSWRLHYLWNDANDQPNLALFPPGTQQVQAGQAIHLNFATGYSFFDHKLHAGINGYYLKQFTDTKIDAVSVSRRKEEVLGIGPGAVYHFTKDAHFYLNLYFEPFVENRPSGTRLNALFAYHF